VFFVPAIQNFNGSDFSVRILSPFLLDERVDRYALHVIHRRLPLIFTHHTQVPAFEFIDRHTRLRHAMFLPASAHTIAGRLRQTGKPLLAGGSSYSNIYAGGAETARYCAETMNLESLIRATNPFRLFFFFCFRSESCCGLPVMPALS